MEDVLGKMEDVSGKMEDVSGKMGDGDYILPFDDSLILAKILFNSSAS
jgi:hypothetical protein